MWGLYQGFFLVLERMSGMRTRGGPLAFIGHAYTLLVVMFGWIIFRAGSLSHAWNYLSAMFGQTATSVSQTDLWRETNYMNLLVLAIGAVLSSPVVPWLRRQWLRRARKGPLSALHPVVTAGDAAFHICLLLLCIGSLASGSYNPFIYFRF